MEYDQAARKRLGRAVRAARVQAGDHKREDFASKMGRSARQVQALERGETGVGPDTWMAAARALDWPIERIYDLLEGRDTGVTPSPLTSVTDEDLAAEVLRRMKGEAGGDTTPIAQAAAQAADSETHDHAIRRGLHKGGLRTGESEARHDQGEGEAGAV